MHPPGESMGSLYRVWNLCQGLTKMSHKCFVFLPFNCFEDWGPLVKFITVPVLSSGGTLSKRIYRFTRKMLDVKFLSNPTILNPKIFALSMRIISKVLLDTITKNQINLDVFVGETEIGGLILTNIKRELKAPIIVDYQNFWPEELVEHRIIKRYSRRYKSLISLEKNVINQADLVITISKTLENFLKHKFNNKNTSKIKTINNGGVPLLDKPKKKDLPPKIINSGMVVQRSNFKLFFESLPYLLKKYPDTHIYVTKKGELLNYFMKLANKMNLNQNIKFYWKDTYQEYIKLLSDCHLGIVTSSYDLTRKLGFVAKIYDYFSVGLPVVGNNIGGWTSMIAKEKVGLLSSRDPRDLADMMIEFIENPKMAYEYGQRAINLLKNKYNVKFAAQNLINCIESIH